MNPLRQQFIDALGYKGKTLGHYRDFTLTILAGCGVLVGEIFAIGPHSTADSGFDVKIAVGCFALAVVCVLLTSNRLTALVCAILIPVVFMRRALFSRQTARMLLIQIAAAFVVLLVGVIAKLLWQRLRIRRTR